MSADDREPLVVLDALCRTYATRPRRPGVRGALADLFGGPTVTVRALDGVHLALRPGEAVGLLGPNGAGKSTLIKCVAGILLPSGGTIRVGGRDPFRERAAHVRQVGAVFGHRTQLWWELAVQEAFALIGAMHGMSAAALAARLATLDGLLDLGPLLRVPVRELSLGQRIRCELAAALLHSPRLLLLDEPTIGLDLGVRRRVRAFLRALAEAHEVTLLLSSHDLADVEQVCERVVVLDAGRVAFDGTLDGLRERAGVGRVVVVEAGAPLADSDWAVLEGLGRLERRSPTRLALHLAPGATAGRALAALSARIEVVDLHVEAPPTEEVVAALWERRA